MKKRILTIFILIFVFFLAGNYSDTEEIIEKQIEIANNSDYTEYFSDETTEILENLGIYEPDIDSFRNIDFADIVRIFFDKLVLKIKEPIYSIASVMTVSIICSLMQSICENFSQTGKVLNTVSVLFVSTSIIIPIKNIISSCVSVIEECSGFMLGFIPVYSSAVISAGYISSAAGFRTLLIAASTIISEISGKVAAPIICIYAAMCIAGSVSDFNIKEISKSFKNFAVWTLTITMTVFSGIMGLGVLITSSADGTFSKTTKFLIGSTIPIVGGTVAEAFSTIKGCLIITKNILGVYSIAVIASIFLPTIISLIIWKTSLSVSSAIGAILDNKKISELLSSASSVLGIMLALISITAVTFIFSLSIMLMTGVS